LIEKVVASGVRTVPDLYELTVEQVSALDRMGEASAKQAIAELWKAVPMPLEAFLGALSIPLCATSTIQAIVEAGYDDLPKIRACDTATLRQIPGVGPKRADALHTWLGKNATLLDRLLAVGVKIQPRAKGSLTGQSVCFTGKSTMKRVDLEAMAKSAGASVKNSVGKGLTYLVSADPDSTSSKAQAARKNGTACISEEAFVRLCKGS
jgi:DNA ligase (NAD+)